MRRDWILKAIPGIQLARSYQRSWLKSDLAAGAALSALLIPAGMAYAEASGLPAVNGLYASVVPMLFYAVFGPSRVLIVGPDSALVPMIAAAVLPLAGREPSRAVALAGVLAILIGVFLIAGRIFRLGFVTGLLSKPIRVGYLNGIALAVIVSQLPKLLGISVQGGSLQANAIATAEAVSQGATNPVALVFGVATVAIIVAGRFLPWKVPGVLLAVAASIAAAAALGLKDAMPMVGALPQGLPAPALGGVTTDDVVGLLGPAAGIALIAFADTSTLSKSLAGRGGVHTSGNQEMAGLGIANVASGLLGGFPVCGSSSRTPTALQAGARTPFSGIVAAALVVVFMVAAPGVTAFLPTATLAAVVIVAAASLVDVKTLLRLIRMSRMETALLVTTFLGVAFVGVLQGIVIAIALSLIAFIRRAWDPYRTELASLEDVPGYHDISRHPEGLRVPGLVIARFDAPLFFANGEVFAEHIRDLVADAPGPVKCVIVASEAITDLDTTALDDLVELDDELASQGISLVFAELKGPVKDRLIRFGVSSRFGPDHFFPTINNAVKSYKRTFGL
ncbi:SulP family inorganic anion transporter [Arthrobacter oryzae]|uniref:SulP family inorganic anion transporter n=1 Tax=Arthrobacter oryzae TaxID=409290 RepID=UPI00285E568E|nr:SulP family inorganic anion transporter [Arthrobacter oryzae]MDR6505927.1 high affinity sulfate transporter 1 [Arthrobacter oryzae]